MRSLAIAQAAADPLRRAKTVGNVPRAADDDRLAAAACRRAKIVGQGGGHGFIAGDLGLDHGTQPLGRRGHVDHHLRREEFLVDRILEIHLRGELLAEFGVEPVDAAGLRDARG